MHGNAHLFPELALKILSYINSQLLARVQMRM